MSWFTNKRLGISAATDIATLVASLSQTCLGFWDARTLGAPGSYSSWPGRAGTSDLALSGNFTLNASRQVVATANVASVSSSVFDMSTGTKTVVLGYLAQVYSGSGFGFWAGIAALVGNQGQYMDRAAQKGAEGAASAAGGSAFFQGTVGAWAGQRSSNNKLLVGALSTNATPNTTVQYYPALPITAASAAGTNGAGNNTFSVGGFAGNFLPFTGRWAACFAGALSNSDLAKLNVWSQLHHATTNDPGAYVVFDGDSRTLGIPSSVSDMSTNFPTVAMADARLANYGDCNFGQGGQTAQNMATRFSTVPHVVLTASVSAKKIYVLFAGINDFAGARTAAQIYADLKTSWAAARADGAKVVACTEISAGTAGWDAGAKETLNALIVSVPTLYDALADFGANANVGADGQSSNATYFQAGAIHPTALGYSIMAGIVANAIASL